MDIMEQLVELLGKLPEGTPDEVKTGVKGLFQKVSVEAGKAKTDLEGYKKGDSQYKKLQKQFKDSGLDEEQIDLIAEKLGYAKTLEDEHAIVQATLKETVKAKKDLENSIKVMKLETVLGGKVQEVAKAYKTPEGQTIKISERFIDKKELYKDIDLNSEVLVQDRIQNVMKSAFENQSAFIKELEMEGTPVHTVNVGQSTFGSGKALDTAAVVSVIKQSKGSLDGAAHALGMYEKPTGT
jgi:hypothetical protein